jgi:hypothetical protein
MTSTSLDEPWLRVSGLDRSNPHAMHDGPAVAKANLVTALAGVGASVDQWQAVEIMAVEEVERRGRHRRAVPPMVSARKLAELAGITVQRIYQLDTERRSGKRDDFPAPAVDGYWLRAAADRWVRERRTRPGPRGKRDDE